MIRRDAWEELWDLATGDPDGDAQITPTERMDTVLLTWSDGSQGCVRWSRYGWQFLGEHNACPGDVVARDAL